MSLILLIDDEPGMASLVEMSLNGMGARVILASSLADALAAARRERPSALLLDFALGNEDGIAILPHLRDDPALQGVPIVAFTVHDSRKDEALQKGVEGFVVKPFSAAALRSVLEPFLE